MSWYDDDEYDEDYDDEDYDEQYNEYSELDYAPNYSRSKKKTTQTEKNNKYGHFTNKHIRTMHNRPIHPPDDTSSSTTKKRRKKKRKRKSNNSH